MIEIKNLTAANDDLNEENNRLRDELDAISKNPVKPPSSIGGPSPVSRAAPSDQAAYNPGNNEAGGMAARPDAVVSQQRVDSFQQAMSDFLNCAKYVFLLSTNACYFCCYLALTIIPVSCLP